jgi:PAS domain S-box-containing protein
MDCLAQYAQIFDHLRDGVMVTDAEGTIVDWNVGAERLFGYSKREIIGQTPAILQEPNEGPVLAKSLLEDVAEGGVWRGEITMICKNGEKRTCETTLTPLFNEGAEFSEGAEQVGIVIVTHDITSRKLAEQRIECDRLALEQIVERSTQELQIAQWRLQNLVVNSPAMPYTRRRDADFAVTYVSPQVSLVTGYDRTDFTTQTSFWEQRIHPGDKERVVCELDAVIQHGIKHSPEYRFRHANGSYFWVRDEMNMVNDSAGHPLEIVGYWTDITERKAAEREVLEVNNQLEMRVAQRTSELHASNARLATAHEALKRSKQKSAEQARLGAIGEIASGVSHNLNNMLSPSIILLDLLLTQEGLSGQTRELVSAIRTGTHDAAQLVSRLGLLYRKKDLEAKHEPVDLHELMEEIPALTAGKWRCEPRETGRDITLELQLEKVPIINANATDLRQCLVNLVFNAVDAIKHSGVIYLRLKNKGDSVVITVQDSGRGMTAIEQQQCLEPFFTTKAAGTGLGLPLCVGIVENHQGQFSLRSTPCEGTSIDIEIPVKPLAQVLPGGEAESLLATYRILYIDDEPIVRKSMALLLETLGHKTDVAENGFVGIEKFKENEYDIVISDFSMPGLNGRRVASAIKALSPATIVILVTGWPVAHIAPDAQEEALEDSIIGKPVTIEKLRNVLNTTKLTPR